MKIAIVAVGFQPSRAGELRRAMATSKTAGTIHTFKDEFIRGMLARNYDRDFAGRCFSQIQGFGTYGFPGLEADELPLLKSKVSEKPKQLFTLPPLRDEEAVTEDYSVFGLSLRNHPMSPMRSEFRSKGMTGAADLKNNRMESL